MSAAIKTTVALMFVALATQASAQFTVSPSEEFRGQPHIHDRAVNDQQPSSAVTLYTDAGFRGRAVSIRDSMPSLDAIGFSDRASSLVVEGTAWEFCEHSNFRGRCLLLSPGRYPSLESTGLGDSVSSLRRVDVIGTMQQQPSAIAPAGELVMYDGEGFEGQSFATREAIENLSRQGFNDRASSIAIRSGVWQVCSDSRFSGRCVTLRPGQYPTLESMALNDRVSSVRIDEDARAETQVLAVVPTAVFFEQEGFRGRSYTQQESNFNFDRRGLNVRAGSVEVRAGTWDVCEDPRLGGQCAQLQPGRYPTPSSMGLSDRIASTRTLDASGRMIGGLGDRGDRGGDRRGAQPAYDGRRLGN